MFVWNVIITAPWQRCCSHEPAIDQPPREKQADDAEEAARKAAARAAIDANWASLQAKLLLALIVQC